MTGSSGGSEYGSVLEHALGEGERLGPFAVRTVLSADGFYITYRCAREADEDVVVRECFPAGAAVRASDGRVEPATPMHESAFSWAVARCIEQANLLGRVDHPNVVRLRDVFEARNTAYVVTELTSGVTLEQAVRERGLLSPEAVTRIGHDIASALTALQEQGIAHRALNPDTVLVRPDGSGVLREFECACLVSSLAHAPVPVQKPGFGAGTIQSSLRPMVISMLSVQLSSTP